jgi:TonB family protein
MGYQALLFCPDEKTARTVTQVLSELDFTVVPCTEPFAAVKRLMGEHFDAVVVDCDNEQNATLLFKSARNAPNNQSALAVAVVEGQAGVAKAFRIGANLVLTKPINVEQAKGTLRVARGLLRKNESAKPATMAQAKPTLDSPAPATGKPVLVTRSSAPSVSAISPGITPSAPVQKPVAQPSFAALASSAGTEVDESVKEASTPAMTSAAPESKPAVTSSKAENASARAGLSVLSSSGAATAAAPAREEVNVAEQQKSAEVIPEAKAAVEKEAIAEEKSEAASSEVQASAAPAPSFTFGGAVESGDKPAGGGSKKVFIAVAAIVVIAAGGYFAWTQFGPSHGATTVSTPVAVRPATAPVPQAAPSAVAAPAVVNPPAVPSSTTSVPTTETQLAKVAKANVPAATAPAAQTRVSKANPVADSGKTVVADSKVPATSSEASQPIVVKKGTAESAAGKSEPASDVPAPSITGIATASNGGTLPNLLSGSSGAPAPVLQTLSISQGVSQGLILKKISPPYPTNALRMRIEGSVELLATISKKGDISSVKILSGDPNLARAAADAVKQWKYKPYLLDGSPVEIQTQVTVNFKLPR